MQNAGLLGHPTYSLFIVQKRTSVDVVIESFFRPSAICGVQPDGAIVFLALPPDVDNCYDIARLLTLCPQYCFPYKTQCSKGNYLTVGAHNAATRSPTPPPMAELWPRQRRPDN